MTNLNVFTFNLLAPIFASPNLYHCLVSEEQLSVEYRRERWFSLLEVARQTADIICLQEVTDDTLVNKSKKMKQGEYPRLCQLLENDFYCFFVAHNPEYWSHYLHSKFRSPYSYMKHGNAIFIKRNRFSKPSWTDLSQSTGNHAALATTTEIETNLQLQLVCLHLDNSGAKSRTVEIDEITKQLTLENCLLIGDFNCSLGTSNVDVILSSLGFVDVIQELEQHLDRKINEATRPDIRDGPRKAIDRVFYKGRNLRTKQLLTRTYGVHSFPGQTLTGILSQNLYITHPIDLVNSKSGLVVDRNELNRVLANFELYGSDHLPFVATIELLSIKTTCE